MAAIVAAARMHPYERHPGAELEPAIRLWTPDEAQALSVTVRTSVRVAGAVP